MFTRSELGHDAAEGCVGRDLARELVGHHPPLTVENGHGGLIARGFDGEGAQKRGTVSHEGSVWQTQRGGCRLPVVTEAWKELRFYRRFARTGTVTLGKSSSVVARVKIASRDPGSASGLTVTVT